MLNAFSFRRQGLNSLLWLCENNQIMQQILNEKY
jgi:hypothetical protein